MTPTESLDQLVGTTGEGAWTLKVADLDGDDLGTFETWALELECL